MSSNVLILAPHADDEILGCGGVMKKHINKGDNVFVVILTNAHVGAPELYKEENIKTSRQEALLAHRYLGVKETIFMDFPAPRLSTFPTYQISIALNDVFKKLEIQTLYIPHRGDIHKDHYIAFEAALVAARPVHNYCVKKILAYETLSETEWAAPFPGDIFVPNVYIEIENEIHNKCEAMKFFHSQLREFPSSRSIETINALAKFRGATISRHAAEAFMLIREIL